MAQAGSNDEKNGGPKSRWTVPLKTSCKNANRLEKYLSGAYCNVVIQQKESAETF